MKVEVKDLFLEGVSTLLMLFCSSNNELLPPFLSKNFTDRDLLNLTTATSGLALTYFVFRFLSCEVKTLIFF